MSVCLPDNTVEKYRQQYQEKYFCPHYLPASVIIFFVQFFFHLIVTFFHCFILPTSLNIVLLCLCKDQVFLQAVALQYEKKCNGEIKSSTIQSVFLLIQEKKILFVALCTGVLKKYIC